MRSRCSRVPTPSAAVAGRRSSRCRASCTTRAPRCTRSRWSRRSCESFPWRSTASSWCIPRCRWRIRSTTARRCCSSDPSRRPRAGSAPTIAPTASCSIRSSTHADELTSEILGPLRVPRHPLVLAPVRTQGAALGLGAGALSLRGRAGAGAVGRLQRALHAVPAYAGGRGGRDGARCSAPTGSAGRSPAAARNGWRTRWPATSARSAGRIETGHRWSRSRSSTASARRCST